eukprot:CAMPEP_0179338076 /NCGR_PEP_ID=MMETSP0797-20121207/67985_1 /TAXON_ID=47934 /ORGANISM="Dinophysis acuminata, Strain DAEP01" /LENGTH=81 /DNA_ID=CAMNT_0021051809 /DNA_START=42 /DNA_END=284 /DNA_ORIENTATION=+
MPTVWLVADLISCPMNAHRARGLWQPSAARNMMVSLASTVPVTAVICAQYGLSTQLKWRHPSLIGTHCLLTCNDLLIARRR